MKYLILGLLLMLAILFIVSTYCIAQIACMLWTLKPWNRSYVDYDKKVREFWSTLAEAVGSGDSEY